MNVMDLFAGIGGASYAGKLIGGWRTVCYVEWDKYCQQVIQARIRDGIFDDAPIWDDVQTFDGAPWLGLVDIITAGFPCQPFSVAGKQQGESDERNMWPDTIRIIGEVRPRFAFLENVPALIASGYFGRILGDLSEIGYDCRWTIVSAADVGAPHLRKRLWILAYPNEYGTQRDESEHRQRCGTMEGGQICDTTSEGLSDRRSPQVGESRSIPEPERSDCTWWDTDPADLPDTEKSGLERSISEGDSCPDGCLAEQGSFNVDNSSCGRHASQEGEISTGGNGIEHSSGGQLKSFVGRVAHGVPDRVNRLKGLGNAWVPQVACVAWNILTEGLI